MKKIVLCAMLALAAITQAQEVGSPQYIITDCGTVHVAPSQLPTDAIIFWQEFWTERDCN